MGISGGDDRFSLECVELVALARRGLILSDSKSRLGREGWTGQAPLGDGQALNAWLVIKHIEMDKII